MTGKMARRQRVSGAKGDAVQESQGRNSGGNSVKQPRPCEPGLAGSSLARCPKDQEGKPYRPSRKSVERYAPHGDLERVSKLGTEGPSQCSIRQKPEVEQGFTDFSPTNSPKRDADGDHWAEEPDAGNPPVRLCAGASSNGRPLPRHGEQPQGGKPGHEGAGVKKLRCAASEPRKGAVLG